MRAVASDHHEKTSLLLTHPPTYPPMESSSSFEPLFLPLPNQSTHPPTFHHRRRNLHVGAKEGISDLTVLLGEFLHGLESELGVVGRRGGRGARGFWLFWVGGCRWIGWRRKRRFECECAAGWVGGRRRTDSAWRRVTRSAGATRAGGALAGLLLAVMAAAGSVCLCCGWVGCWDEFLFDRSSIMMMISLPLVVAGAAAGRGHGGRGWWHEGVGDGGRGGQEEEREAGHCF